MRRGAEVRVGEADGAAGTEVEIVVLERGTVVGREEIDGLECAVRLHDETGHRFGEIVRRLIPGAWAGQVPSAVAGRQQDLPVAVRHEARTRLPDAAARHVVAFVAPHRGDRVRRRREADDPAVIRSEVAARSERGVHDAVHE